MKKNALIYHSNFKKYGFGPDHPLKSDRYNELTEVFASSHLQKKKDDLIFVKPKPAAFEDVKRVHSSDYIRLVETLNHKGGLLSRDTPFHPGLYDTARLFAGAEILAGRLIVENIFRRAVVLGGAGHHAGYDFGGGFCIINDMAIAVEYLRRSYNQSKILLLDIDAHCGNGTQNIYYDSSIVLCVDMHEDPLNLYPGTGFPEQIGLKKGKGYTVNIPFPPGSGDEDYMCAFDRICRPIILEFQPQIIFIFGGADTHYSDPLSHLNLTLNGIYKLMKAISELADDTCDGKVVLSLGASFAPKILTRAWQVMISAMSGIQDVVPSEPYKLPERGKNISDLVQEMISRVINIQKKYWKNL